MADNTDLIKHLPKSGWLYDYLHYTKSLPFAQTEVPLIYNVFIGISTIAACLKRNVYVSRGMYEIFPAMLVVLIGPTGRGKKTTAINLGKKLLEKAKVAKILSESVTPEALIESLRAEKIKLKHGQIVTEVGDSTGLLILPELSVFLQKRDYRSGLVPLITRLGDAPDYFNSETIGRGLSPLNNVALSMQAGTAKSWLIGTVPVEAFRGGFMARFLFVCSDGVAVPVSRPPALDSALQAKLITGLKTFDKLRGEISVDDDAEAYFTDWYNHFYYHRSIDEKRAAYQERKHDHLMRIALILAVSDHRDHITTDDVKRSLGLLDILEEDMFQLFGEIERGQTPVGENLQMVLSLIKRKGVMGRTELLRRVVSKGITAANVDEIIDSLQAGGYITETRKNEGQHKVARVYTYKGEVINE